MPFGRCCGQECPRSGCDEIAGSAEARPFKPTGVDALTQTISNPPTQAEVQAIQDKVNELLAALTV